MNSRAILACLALVTLAGMPVSAQEGGIKSTTTLHPDGTRTDMIQNFATRTAESKTYDAGGKVIQSMKYTLDEQGKLAEGTAFSAKGVAMYKYTYRRDSTGQLQEEDNLTPEGKLLRRLVYHYKTNGEIGGIDTYDAQGNLLKPVSPGIPDRKKSSRSR